MSLKTWITVGSIALIFLFLPSLGLKLWDFLIYAPWGVKSWLFYLGLAGIALFWVRLRKRKQASAANLEIADQEEPIIIAKRRLAMGEINLTEYRELKQELELS